MREPFASVSDVNETGVSFVSPRIGHPLAAQFGIASVGTVIFIITPQILLLYFLTAILRIPPAWAGVALLLPKLVEFVFDIGVGSLSDRWRGRMGRRLPFLLVGAALFPLAFAGVFAPPEFADWRASLAWVTTVSLTATLAYTLFSIPYITMVGEMSDRPADRIRVTAWRMAFVSVGVLVAGAVAPAIVEAEGGGRGGYAAMGTVLAAVAGAATLIALPAAWRLRTAGSVPSRTPFRLITTALIATPAYARMWISYVLQMAGVSVNAALLPFAVIYQLRASESAISIIFMTMTVATLVVMPVSVVLARRIGSVSALAASLLTSAVGTAGMIAGTPILFAVMVTAALVFGMGQAGASSLPFALLPEVSATGDAKVATANAGLFTAIWVAGERLGLALGGTLAASLLAIAGFDSGSTTQPATTVAAIPWLFGGVPTVLFLAAILPLLQLRNTSLNRKAHA